MENNTPSNEQTMATITITSQGSTLTTASPVLQTPKEVKGGVFAAADIAVIKDALAHYARQDLTDFQQRQVANLLHRLNSRI